jgi:putative ABC transport system ATP-binding protein
MLTPTTIPTTLPTAVAALGLTRHYGDGETVVRALDGVDIDIQEGRLTAIMGASGSGKSTLMHLLAGLDRPTSGSVLVAGRELTEMNDDELTRLRREHIGFVFQFFNLLPMLTAKENVLLPMAIAGTKPDPAWFDELIATVGLGDRLGWPVSECSRQLGA